MVATGLLTLSLVAIWNSYVFAPRTGDQLNDGVRAKLVAARSSTRSRNGFRCFGAGTACADGATTSAANATTVRRARRMTPAGCRHPPSNRRHSFEGQRGLQRLARCEDEGVRSRTADELDRCRQAVLRRPARERQRRPPERVEGDRELDRAHADVELDDVGRR